MKSYTLRQNGRKMCTRHIRIHIDEALTDEIMARQGVGQREAEAQIISAMVFGNPYAVVGMGVDDEGYVVPGDQPGATEFHCPLATGW